MVKSPARSHACRYSRPSIVSGIAAGHGLRQVILPLLAARLSGFLLPLPLLLLLLAVACCCLLLLFGFDPPRAAVTVAFAQASLI